MGTNGDNSNMTSVLVRHSLYRGIYSRVAQQLGVDRSYVSRVANGQRRSAKVEKALLKEINRIEKLSRR
jgi:transcriptional regulator with XRE-family HTH domain